MAPRQLVQLAAVPAVYVAGSPPKVAVVHATAVFENCPSSLLGQEDVESLHRFSESELHISTSRLSETPVKYIRRNLEKSE